MTMAEQKNKMKHVDNKELAARLLAVQAYYQISQNKQPMRAIIQEYLDHRASEECASGDNPAVKPDGALFKRILCALDDRADEVKSLLEGCILKPVVAQESAAEPVETPELSALDESGANQVQEAAPATRPVEPLLRSILMCGICELLVHSDVDSPLIIDDYLNVAHAFYEPNQVRFVNGVLDSIASILRGS